MDWQPIETASLKDMDRDCARFLASDGQSVWVASVFVLQDGRIEFTDELSHDHDLYGKDNIETEITHWMPLPAPPTPDRNAKR